MSKWVVPFQKKKKKRGPVGRYMFATVVKMEEEKLVGGVKGAQIALNLLRIESEDLYYQRLMVLSAHEVTG